MAGMTAKRIVLCTLFASCFAVPALADPRSDAVAGMARCQSIANDRTFLDCIYGAAQPLRAELNLPPAPSWQIGLVPPPFGAPAIMPQQSAPTGQIASAAPSPPASGSGGFFSSIFGSGKELVPPTPMASYSFAQNGTFTVHLRNGQVWRQQTGDTSFAHWYGPASNYIVTIRQGALDSYNMEVRGEGAAYKVVRAN